MKKIHTYRRAIVFLVIVQYCLTIGYASDEAGCSHNGTMFADGSLVPSLEPCLNCKCENTNLICSLRVCPEQPIPPPRGCILVHKRLSCCPHLSCKKYHNENENHDRRVITYNSNWYKNDADDLNGDQDERQKVISKNSLYRRIDDEEIDGNDQMCVHNGTIYRTGSAMSTSSLCSYCYCIGGKQKCVRPKCLLASPGCVPVFIDSSCCPIRYNCGTTDLRSPLESKNSYYRIENKHYHRMRSRAQRSRGCLVKDIYYPEGEKLPTDTTKPCDICFCIRGERKCTPKKCAPYIGNCKPTIPEGQCCPANYVCDHSIDDTYFPSSHKPRQFGLFSYFFGDEIANETSKEPDYQSYSPTSDHSSPVSSTSEKSFLDALREGLNYIDSNDEHVENILDSSGVNATTTDRPLQKNTSELSFFDILLSDDDDDDNDSGGYVHEVTEEPLLHNEASLNYSDWTHLSDRDENSAIKGPDPSTNEFNHDRYALLDEHTAYETTVPPPYIVNSVSHFDSSNPVVKTSSYDRSATEKIIKEYITFTPITNYEYELSTISTNQDFETTTFVETTTQDPITFSTLGYGTINTIVDENRNNWPSTNPTHDLQDDHIPSDATFGSSTEIEEYTKSAVSITNNGTDQITESEPSIVSTFFDNISNLFGDQNSLKKVNTVNDQTLIIEPQKTIATIPPVEVTHFGSEIQLSTEPYTPKTTRRVNPTIISSPSYQYVTPASENLSSTLPTISKTLPTRVTTSPPQTTVTSSLPTTKFSSTSSTIPPTKPARRPTSTSLPPKPTSTPSTTSSTPKTTTPTTTAPQLQLTTLRNTIYAIDGNEHQTTPKIILTTIIQTNKPPIIDSNPSILESELNYDYDQPTLPPSLPNLKIIPFLPTDAVQKENVNVKSNFDYYPNNPTSYSVLTENYENPYLTSDRLSNQNTDFTAYEVGDSEVKLKDTFNRNNEKSDFNSYSIESTDYSNEPIFGVPNTNVKSSYDQYPSLTEKPNLEQTLINKYPGYSKYSVDYDYDSFDPEKRLDANKYVPGSYEVIDSHDYSIQGRNPTFDKYITEYPERRVYSKIEFSTSNPLFGFNGNNKFSPPSETEGGFLPKEPIQDDQYYDKFHTTKFISELTTEQSLKANSTGLFIGITSEDPFKNVIRTESPPNLLTLIEDKEKLYHTNPELSIADIDHDYPSIHLSDIEKDIISITTDASYNSTPEYAHEPWTEDIEMYASNYSISNINITSVNSDKLTNISTKYSTEKSVSSNSQSNPTKVTVPKDFFGSLLGYIFKDSDTGTDPKPTDIFEKQTIPPFKKISPTALTLMDILNFTKPVENSSKKVDIPQRKNNKIYEYPTTPPLNEETQKPKVENLSILRDVLLATLNSPSNLDPTANTDSLPTIDVPKPIYSSHSIHQFLNPIFAGNSELTHVTSKYTPIRSEIDLTIPKLNSQVGDNKDELINNVFGPESYQVLNDYPSISNSRPFGENPIDYDSLKEHHSEEHSPNIYTQPLKRFQNSMSILKLAGCNIYGRMYRVGRIITELSNPCLECKCTEVGVHCTPLNC